MQTLKERNTKISEKKKKKYERKLGCNAIESRQTDSYTYAHIFIQTMFSIKAHLYTRTDFLIFVCVCGKLL